MSVVPRRPGTPSPSPESTAEASAGPLVRRRRVPFAELSPTWRLARPRRIAAGLAAAHRVNGGGWFVAGRSGDVPGRNSVTRTIAGREVVMWRDRDGQLVAGPGACPHLGALLTDCPVVDGVLLCRWHGYPLPPTGSGSWRPYRAHDDGLLVWVGLPVAGEPATPTPVVPLRPPAGGSVAAVITVRGRCEPDDVISNRLDPWHGAWFHPYSFSHLEVDESASDDTVLTVDVTFRLNRTLGVPVRAEFSCPDPRTIVMRIVDGDGAGSVVETHATPIGGAEPATVITEAVLAYSDRPGFAAVRRLGPLMRPAMRKVARRLWVDDLTYAERRFRVRTRGAAGV